MLSPTSLGFSLPLCETGIPRALASWFAAKLHKAMCVAHTDGSVVILEVCDGCVLATSWGAASWRSKIRWICIRRVTSAPGHKWVLHEPGRLQCSWRKQQCVHGVTCSAKLCKRKIFWCFHKEVSGKFQAPQILALSLPGGVGAAWITLGGREKGGWGRRPENDFHVCRLM